MANAVTPLRNIHTFLDELSQYKHRLSQHNTTKNLIQSKKPVSAKVRAQQPLLAVSLRAGLEYEISISILVEPHGSGFRLDHRPRAYLNQHLKVDLVRCFGERRHSFYFIPSHYSQVQSQFLKLRMLKYISKTEFYFSPFIIY